MKKSVERNRELAPRDFPPELTAAVEQIRSAFVSHLDWSGLQLTIEEVQGSVRSVAVRANLRAREIAEVESEVPRGPVV